MELGRVMKIIRGWKVARIREGYLKRTYLTLKHKIPWPMSIQISVLMRVCLSERCLQQTLSISKSIVTPEEHCPSFRVTRRALPVYPHRGEITGSLKIF